MPSAHPTPPSISLTPHKHRPWVIAHRGDSAHAVENSLAAFTLAVTKRADAIETDVRLSADGIPVLCHDASVLRVTGQPGLVAEHTAAALATLPLQDARGQVQEYVGIPSLAVALRQAPQCPFFLEMKGDDLTLPSARRALAEATAQVAMEAVAEGVVAPILLSFEADLLQMAAAVAPTLTTARNMEHPLAAEDVFLSCSVRTLTSAMVHQAHRAKQMVLCFTINDSSQLQRALAFGVDGIFSDDPAWLRGKLRDTFSDDSK